MNDNWFKKYGWLIPLSLLFLATAFMMLMASNQAKTNRIIQDFSDFGFPASSLSIGSSVIRLSVPSAPSDEIPADEAVAEEAPAEEVPVEGVPAEEAPAEEAPAEGIPAEEAPVIEVPVEKSVGREYVECLPEAVTDEILLEIRDILSVLLSIVLFVLGAFCVYLIIRPFRYLWRY